MWMWPVLLGLVLSSVYAVHDTKTLLDDQGTIEVQQYAPFEHRQWIIRPSGFGSLTLNFEWMYLEGADGRPSMSLFGCHDFVRVYNSDAAGKPPCTQLPPPDAVDYCVMSTNAIELATPLATVEFCTNGDTQLIGGGFALSYQFEPYHHYSINQKRWFIFQESSSCGLSLFGTSDEPHRRHRRMINGQESDPNQWPWVAAIFDGKAPGHFFCTGSYVGDGWVLTAGHCFNDKFDVSDMRVKLGAHQRGDIGDINEATQMLCGIKKVVMKLPFHPTKGHDIALVKLDCNVEITSSIQPICLPSSDDASWQQGGTEVINAGWGWQHAKLDPNAPNPVASLVLMQIHMVTANHQKCSAAYGGFINQNFICTLPPAGKPQTFCMGDSGGPLMSQVQGRWTQIGVVAFNHNCDPMRYTFYTYVPQYLDWIHDTIKAD